MNQFRISAGTVLLLLFISLTNAAAQQRLFVVGGGSRPPEGMKKFVEWAGGAKANVLVVTWASGEPQESFAALRRDFLAAGAGNVTHGPTRPLDATTRNVFLTELAGATAVFFSGGDQNRIMDVLADADLLARLRAKYSAGTPFGGTSAGAAAISDPMMTGEADLKVLDGAKVGVRPGIGLLPYVMFDQHFLVRQRHNRLFGFVMQNPAFLGVGIDEDNAVLIEDNRRLTVAGKTWVMFVRVKDKHGAMAVDFLKPGERFDLKDRKRKR